jgi:thiamine-phosphate pyrophosphorylase
MRGLYAIVDSQWNPMSSLVQLAEQYLKGGARTVQLRVKRDASAGGDVSDVVEAARGIMRLKKRWPFVFIINDYVDVAVDIGADGVHVGANDMPVEEVKARVPEGMLVGYSSHSTLEARAAVDSGADYVAFGAIFPTCTKGPGHPVQGVAALGEVVQVVGAPVVAIGGINRENIASVLETGVSSVAMITALSTAKSVVDEVRWYVETIEALQVKALQVKVLQGGET